MYLLSWYPNKKKYKLLLRSLSKCPSPTLFRIHWKVGNNNNTYQLQFHSVYILDVSEFNDCLKGCKSLLFS